MSLSCRHSSFLESTLRLQRFLLLSIIVWCSCSTTTAFCPVVICPGFGNDVIDYEAPLEQSKDVGLVSVLERRGFDSKNIYIVPIKRPDWLRVALGLFDIPNFYTNSALPTGLGYGWYVKRLKETIDKAYNESGNKKVLVIAHSAGGWLARAAIGDGSWENTTNNAASEASPILRSSDRIRALVTVGAIHRPPENPSTCVTRGALAYTDQNYPGAFLQKEGIQYVSVGGNAIVGDKEKRENEEERAAAAARVAYTSYESVCGKGEGVCGDGVVPLEWSMLDGSRQIPLEGVLHSINEAGTVLPSDRWYGAENVIDRWLPIVMEEAGISASSSATNNDT
mmetsp:Transcript_33306/g.36852  ORF Transcript_33306/g.36852 Transcript_33306/m.36852 type:complete len:338 (+) Transcript_33306:122-1135(+)|eukprot:CAMPEP_0194147922 /NCGR_PEP_ID=MMETSP0152-20130528/28827_1 /TAXON_ID=1049557 /ORGANISM="Thalassiothrix antarctica, Strain L6-D1" /LENGTH=337 /DNA_ID=CAMNT_0038849085 /DNA_START=74 /DNA_END=1087 /DNA_ORIENTATION=-